MDETLFVLTFESLIAVAVGYGLGSIPFGLLLTRFAGMGDIRRIGSGNIGATNVLRTGNKFLAALTLFLDGGKGAAAALVMGHWGENPALVAALFAVIGHNFPIWLKFRGGKGVATTLGALLAISWPVGLIACGIWLLTATLFRYSSLSALVALGVAPVMMYVLTDGAKTAVAVALAALAVVRHHANIRRLIHGEEPKIGGGT